MADATIRNAKTAEVRAETAEVRAKTAEAQLLVLLEENAQLKANQASQMPGPSQRQ
jgi:hypothetical protein